ncbi:flagellar basal-body MS-ring/collar protein FliF [uncultured Parvibaculum sp.]|uniref:flagellar basal-body MS-ring/collar protein FliF n=1 Tax=uncultured Parvibaculum sp. TaxID=291828 RepID=UPI000C94F6C6|nr:flagellar M-ring protein FliF [Parvibaculum sp.]
MSNLQNLVKSLGPVRLAVLGVVGAILFGFFAVIAANYSGEPKALLFSDVNVSDASKMVEALDQMKVDYTLKGDGTKIYVPESQALRLRMQLAEKGLPAGGTVGYEIFDNADALGTTSFIQNINHLRALEGELARTIASIDGISSARVHLVLPERELFSRDKRDPTASIVLKLATRALSGQQVKSIQYLVSSAVEGLTPGHVSIVDERGTLLATGMGDDGQAMITATAEERRIAYERRLRGHVENIVGRVVGAGGARVEVTAQMDMTRVVKTSDLYDPDGQVVRSTQTVEDTSSSQNGKQNDGVTVGNNLPNANQTGAGDGATSRDAANRTEETVNYEISRTQRTETKEPGRVERVSVAVLVDGTYTTAADGTKTYQPRSPEELAKIATLVKSAIGFDEKRGDKVEVVNLQFAAPKTVEAASATAPAPEGGMWGLSKADLMRIGEMAMIALLALVAMFFVLRPLIARLGFVKVAPSSADAQLALADGTETPVAAIAGPTGEGENVSFEGNEHLTEDMMIDIAQVAGKVKQSSVRKIGELVNNHPDESLSILRTWLHEPA